MIDNTGGKDKPKKDGTYSFIDNAYTAKDKGDVDKLAALVTEFEDLRSPEYIQDIYAVFKYGGRAVKSDNRVAREARAIYKKKGGRYFWEVRREMLQKKLFLENFAQHPIFQAFKMLPPIEATEKLLHLLRATAQKYGQMTQASQGIPTRGGMKGLGSAPSGGSGGGTPGTGHDFSDIMTWGFFLFDYNGTAFNGGGSGCGAGGIPYFDTREQASQFIQELIDMAGRLMTKDLLVFRLAQVLELGIASSKDMKKVKADDPNDHMTTGTMDEVKDVVHASPVDLVQDEDLLNKKIACKELQVKKYEASKAKKQLLHVMLDVSGSMSAEMWAPMTRADVARSVVMAMLSRVVNKGDRLFLRPYTGAPGPLHRAFNVDEVRALGQKLRDWRFDGGGTRTHDAIMQAIHDIQNAADPMIDRAEILVITDGTDTLHVDEINKAKGKIKIHFLLITEETIHQSLKDNFGKVSDQFLHITQKNGAEEIVAVVK